jgi:phenylalanyl-tRNA synthetase beta chain
MKISYNWLREYTSLDVDPEELSALLTSTGLEVEGMEKYRNIPYSLNGVYTGHVVSCAKHPDADRLSLTKVDAGQGEILDIVCGAPNVQAGQKVLVATVGTSLPDGKGGFFEIKEATIRGAISKGMICAEDELGLGSNHDGIIVLPETTAIGISAETYFELYEDIVFEIGLTPNRADANSHIGVARDVIAYYNTHKSHSGKIQYPNIRFHSEESTCPIDIEIHDSEKCPRYAGILLEKIKVGESPSWIKNRLKAIGLAPINNVVDITNYVLWEYGQPLHAFDAKTIQQQKINVTTLPAQTEFVALDGNKYSLHQEDLMICDEALNPLCIAGVYGGLNSGVTAETESVFLESAVFSASSVRRTSQRHQLQTSAARAFEKGVDVDGVISALQRAVDLLIQYAGAVPSGGIRDMYPTPKTRVQLSITEDYIRNRSGADIDIGQAERILKALEMEVQRDGTTLHVTVPGNKPDVTRPADLLEEILRIYGLDQVPLPGTIKYALQNNDFPDPYEVKETLASYLVSNGYLEMMNLSLNKSFVFTNHFGASEEQLVYIHNTSNTQLNVMRHNLLAGGLETIGYNLNRKQVDLKLFEYGFSYCWENGEAKEIEQIVLWQTGNVESENWLQKQTPTGYFSIKTVVDQLLSRMGIGSFQSTVHEDEIFSTSMRYHRGSENLAIFGVLNSKIAKAFDIKQDVCVAIFEWDACWKAMSNNRIEIKEPSKYPEVRRDLAMVLDKKIQFEEIKKVAYQVEKKWLKNIGLFDVYEDAELKANGKKSYAVSFTLQSADHTLTEQELDEFLNRMIQGMENKLDAVIRR